MLIDRQYVRSKVEISATGCWLWKGQRDKDGYGVFRVKDGAAWLKAHRVSFAVFKGEIAKGLCVLHHCDTPACVNPEHLYAGTRKQNSADMIARGRVRPNLAAARAAHLKLTPGLLKSIRQARRDGLKIREIAAVYSLSPSSVDRALSRKYASVDSRIGL